MQAEPPHFFEVVQKKGEEFLAHNPHPKEHEWRGREYWRAIIAYELKRQQLDDVNHPMWEEYKR
jgi:hypothetical protein